MHCCCGAPEPVLGRPACTGCAATVRGARPRRQGIDQRGSLVDADKLRFDFSYGKQIEAGDLGKVERIVQTVIATGAGVHAKEVPLAKAKEINGLRAVFGEVRDAPPALPLIY